ncbi:MAG: hypothetical protein Ct9H300mP31_19300 [Acidimicrobiaceae bacterium]|nr:MAG: hypothetical protein Ct9H300mP31_19300 [Acidimicrobiaceae bacterium]
MEAGADVITTNSYSTFFPNPLGPMGWGGQAEKLTRLAGHLAREVADSADRESCCRVPTTPGHSYNPSPDATYEDWSRVLGDG